MFDSGLLVEQLQQILDALERIPRRFSSVVTANDFLDTADGQDRLDAICMILIAVGEAFKRIDRKTDGELLIQYPEIDWLGVKGVRDVIAHGYFDIDAEEVFGICKDDIPVLIETTRRLIQNLEKNNSSS